MNWCQGQERQQALASPSCGSQALEKAAATSEDTWQAKETCGETSSQHQAATGSSAGAQTVNIQDSLVELITEQVAADIQSAIGLFFP